MSDLTRFTERNAANAVVAAGYSEKRRLKVNATNIQTSKVFTGSGANDMTPAGTFTGVRGIIYKVLIDAEGTPDTITWFKDGVEQATGVAVTGSAQNLDLGVTVNFGGTDNHTVGDFWEFEATITTDRHFISGSSGAMNLRISLDQEVWYRWSAASSEPAAATTTPTPTADGGMVQSQTLPAGNGITMAVPWGLIALGPNPSKDLYLFIEKHTNDALMQIAEL